MSNRLIILIILLFSTVTIVGGSLVGHLKSQESTTQLESKVSSKWIEKINQSNQVTVAKAIKDENGDSVSSSKEHVLTGVQVNTLKNMLLNDEHYILDKTKRCVFVPEVIFNFPQSGQSMSVSIHCNQIKFVDRNETVIVDYDPMAEAFNRFCTSIGE